MADSFICEHTAEFSLVPHMKSLLEKEFDIVVPIYPWLSRELGRKSRSIHQDTQFRVLVLFPRRPKTSSVNELVFTINSELEDFKQVGVAYGIPVIAGCPEAADFWELAICSDHVWINIGHPDTSAYLVSIDSLAAGPGMPRMKDEDVLNAVRKGKQHTMETLESFVREARHTQPLRFFGGRYKPVYFLMKAY